MIEEWEAVTDKLGDIGPTGDAQAAETAQDLNLMEVADEMADIATGDGAAMEAVYAPPPPTIVSPPSYTPPSPH